MQIYFSLILYLMGTKWTLKINSGRVEPCQIFHPSNWCTDIYLQNTSSNIQTSIWPWSRPRWVTWFELFSRHGLFLSYKRSLLNEADFNLFCTFAVLFCTNGIQFVFQWFTMVASCNVIGPSLSFEACIHCSAHICCCCWVCIFLPFSMVIFIHSYVN